MIIYIFLPLCNMFTNPKRKSYIYCLIPGSMWISDFLNAFHCKRHDQKLIKITHDRNSPVLSHMISQHHLRTHTRTHASTHTHTHTQKASSLAWDHMLDFNLQGRKATGPCQEKVCVCVCVCVLFNKCKAHLSLSSGVKHKTQNRQLQLRLNTHTTQLESRTSCVSAI